jgi:hypothetical protein
MALLLGGEQSYSSAPAYDHGPRSGRPISHGPRAQREPKRTAGAPGRAQPQVSLRWENAGEGSAQEGQRSVDCGNSADEGLRRAGVRAWRDTIAPAESYHAHILGRGRCFAALPGTASHGLGVCMHLRARVSELYAVRRSYMALTAG